jgi:hypothetical protein
MKRFILRLLLFLLILPFVLELSVRLFIPQQLIRFDNIYVPEEGLGQVPAPNLDMTLNTGERDIRYITDSEGVRIGQHPVVNPQKRILVLGDSFVVAMQVEYEDSTVGILESDLSGTLGYPVSVANMGSAAFNVNHYHIREKRELAEGSYDLVVVLLYAGNDFVSRRVDSYEAFSTTTTSTLRLPRSLSRDELVDAVFYPVNDFLETSSHLYVLLKDRASTLLAKVGLSERYFPQELLRSEADSPVWETTASILADIQADAARHQTPVLFALLPSVYQIDSAYLDWAYQAFGVTPNQVDVEQPGKLLAAALRPYTITLLDTFIPLREAYERGNTELFGDVDTHLSPEGHQVVADFLEPYIIKALTSQSEPPNNAFSPAGSLSPVPV